MREGTIVQEQGVRFAAEAGARITSVAAFKGKVVRRFCALESTFTEYLEESGLGMHCPVRPSLVQRLPCTNAKRGPEAHC